MTDPYYVQNKKYYHSMVWIEVYLSMKRALAFNKQANEVKPIAVIGKICAGCNEDLPLEQFSKRKTSPDGHERLCKMCASLKEKKYREGISNRAALHEYKIRYTKGANYDPRCESFSDDPQRNPTADGNIE